MMLFIFRCAGEAMNWCLRSANWAGDGDLFAGWQTWNSKHFSLLVFPYHVIAQEVTMVRERTLRIVLVIVGLLFVAGGYSLVMVFSRGATVAVLMRIFVTLGLFLLFGARSPIRR